MGISTRIVPIAKNQISRFDWLSIRSQRLKCPAVPGLGNAPCASSLVWRVAAPELLPRPGLGRPMPRRSVGRACGTRQGGIAGCETAPARGEAEAAIQQMPLGGRWASGLGLLSCASRIRSPTRFLVKLSSGQLEFLTAAGATVIFREKVSGARADRPQLAKLMASLNAGDMVLITKLDRPINAGAARADRTYQQGRGRVSVTGRSPLGHFFIAGTAALDVAGGNCRV